MYSNRPGKRPDPEVAPVVWELDPATGQRVLRLRAPFQPSDYQLARHARAALQRRRNRELGVRSHGIW